MTTTLPYPGFPAAKKSTAISRNVPHRPNRFDEIASARSAAMSG